MKSFFKKIREFLQRPISNRRGIAMITAIAALTLMTYLAVEVMYDTQVEYIVHSQNINRIKAYYAARSGIDISLLRIKMYQTLVNKLGKNLPTNGMVDQIWQFPFMWPLELPSELNAVETDQIKNAVKESTMDSTFITKITDEGGRIDINDLNSPSKTLRDITRKQLLNIFQNRMTGDEAFNRRHSGYRFEELINNIADWMSNKNSSANGGDKRGYYRELTGSDEFPPNRGFRTIHELRLVKGMNDEFFDILEPNITIYGLKGINPNTASKDVLKAIDPLITDEIVEEIRKRTSPGNDSQPFKNAEDFWTFLQSKGVNPQAREEIPIITSGLYSFRVSSIGSFSTSKREIEVVVMDIDQASGRLNELVKNDAKKEQGPDQNNEQTNNQTTNNNNQATSPASPTASNPLPKGPPRIVYWTEK